MSIPFSYLCTVGVTTLIILLSLLSSIPLSYSYSYSSPLPPTPTFSSSPLSPSLSPSSASPSPYTNSTSVMVWFCLEICNSSLIDITNSINFVNENPHLITKVSYEKYSIDSNGHLIDFSSTYNLSNIQHNFSYSDSITFLPMISSYPHPPSFIIWMRNLFASPSEFFNEAIRQAKVNRFQGFNVDLEPTDGVTHADAILYVKFLNDFQQILNENNLILSVDFASWSPLWDYKLLNLSKLSTHSLISMETYTNNTKDFINHFVALMENITDVSRVGIGFDNEETLSDEFLSTVFNDYIVKYGITEIDIWKMPISGNLVQWITMWREGKLNQNFIENINQNIYSPEDNIRNKNKNKNHKNRQILSQTLF